MYKILFVGAALLALSACNGSNETTAQAPSPEEDAATAELNGPPPPEDVAQESASETTAPEEIEGITNRRLSFEPGASSARIEGVITGYETIDYLLGVRAGQTMNISMASPNRAAYFNLLEPGETEVSVFNGSLADELNMFEGVAAKSGDYRIRIYLYRSAARRNEEAPYTLEAAVN